MYTIEAQTTNLWHPLKLTPGHPIARVTRDHARASHFFTRLVVEAMRRAEFDVRDGDHLCKLTPEQIRVAECACTPEALE
jgi:hypothetical protein